jgi:hypothetical protein
MSGSWSRVVRWKSARRASRWRLVWQPSRFLTDRSEAERAYALAEQLGSMNAAASQLGTTWPSLRKAFTRHGLGMPTPNPEAVRQRAIDAARQRSGQPANPTLDPVFVALNPDALPARERSPAELHQWVRREEQYATLGANVVGGAVQREPRPKPITRAWAIIRRAIAATGWPANAPAAPTAAPWRPSRPHHPGPVNPRSGGWRPMPAELHPTADSEPRLGPTARHLPVGTPAALGPPRPETGWAGRVRQGRCRRRGGRQAM